MFRLGQPNQIMKGILAFITIVPVFGGVIFVKKSGYLSPGPVSDAHTKNQPINGYISHAEFEKQCIHCHAPIHCVTDTRCQDCHIEIARQRSTASGLHGLLPGTDKCQTCHPEHQGRDASITELAFTNVNHEKLTGFSLEKHKQNFDGDPLDCMTCHSQDSYLRETLDCISCHSEQDHDYLAAHIDQYGTGCVDCHDGKDRMLPFDHDLIYPLEGAHRAIACNECHLNNVYRDTPSDCIDCHAEPELHANLFGLECYRCHTAVAWAPAQLLQHTFLLDHGAGEQNIASCETCHAGTYTEYPCYSCHETADMVVAHLGQQIENLEDCIACHPTGRGVAEEPGRTSGGALRIASGKP